MRVPVIASGGCGTVAHMKEALTEGSASAALAASIFHFGEIRIGEARAELLRLGVPVRPQAGLGNGQDADAGASARRQGGAGMSVAIPTGLVTNEAGLVPVIVQDRASGDVLMVAWSNAEALAKTAETGFATFWSRSRKALWRKGETSGHGMRVVEARTDCDRDVLLLVVEPQGPACHTDVRTCFGEDSPTAAGMLEELARVVAERAAAPRPRSRTRRGSWPRGRTRCSKKIGEEAAEVVLAARGESDERLAAEAADLLYHLVVALHERRLPLTRVMDELRQRRSAK